MSNPESPTTAVGYCRHCGELKRGKLVGHVDQASGPGWMVIICPPCERNPPVVPDAEKPRTYSG